jgi:hypothetical protein
MAAHTDRVELLLLRHAGAGDSMAWTRPDAELLVTSCRAGEGSPQPFYLHYGFEKTGEVKWGEDLLRLDLRAPIGGPA